MTRPSFAAQHVDTYLSGEHLEYLVDPSAVLANRKLEKETRQTVGVPLVGWLRHFPAKLGVLQSQQKALKK